MGKNKDWDDGWACGVAYAAAYIAQTHGEDALAAFLLGDTNLSVQDFRRAKPHGDDMRAVSKLYRTDPYLKKSAPPSDALTGKHETDGAA